MLCCVTFAVEHSATLLMLIAVCAPAASMRALPPSPPARSRVGPTDGQSVLIGVSVYRLRLYRKRSALLQRWQLLD
jgi:hypothetical protein